MCIRDRCSWDGVRGGEFFLSSMRWELGVGMGSGAYMIQVIAPRMRITMRMIRKTPQPDMVAVVVIEVVVVVV